MLSLAVTVMVLAVACPAMAEYYNLFGKDLAVEGFIRQEFAFNTNHSNPDKTNQTGLHSAYQMWYLDTNLALSNKLEIRSIFRLWGDMIYALRSDHGHFERYFESSRNNLQWDDNFNQILREFYVTYYGDKFLLRAGKQQIGWGEADGLRLMDVINPLDMRRDFGFYDTEGYQEVRIPKWMIKAEFYPGNIWNFYDIGVELYWNPGDVQNFGHLLPPYADTHEVGGWMTGQQPNQVPKQWGTWSVHTSAVPLPVRFYEKERTTALRNSEYGARIKFNYKSTFMTLNYWQGFETESVNLKFRGVNPDGAGWVFPIPGVFPPFPAAIRMDRIYPRMRVAGFTLSRELYGVGKVVRQVANPVLRVEALYKFEQKFNTAQMAPDMLQMEKYDQIRYMIGFDWSMRMKWINPSKNVFVSGQFFHYHFLNYEGGLKRPRVVPLYVWTYPKNQFYTSLLLRTEYCNENFVPSVLAVWDHHTSTSFIKTKFDFKIGNHWRPQIGYLWIKRNSSHTQPLFGMPGMPLVTDNRKSFAIFHDRDQAWVRIEYQF